MLRAVVSLCVRPQQLQVVLESVDTRVFLSPRFGLHSLKADGLGDDVVVAWSNLLVDVVSEDEVGVAFDALLDDQLDDLVEDALSALLGATAR